MQIFPVSSFNFFSQVVPHPACRPFSRSSPPAKLHAAFGTGNRDFAFSHRDTEHLLTFGALKMPMCLTLLDDPHADPKPRSDTLGLLKEKQVLLATPNQIPGQSPI